MRAVRFFRTALLFPALFCIVRAACAQETPPTQEQGIHVSVERVNVGVIVSDPAGNFVEGLRREDFRVFDNAAEQPISDFAAIEEPAQVLLLIEAGPAVYLLEGGHLQAAHSLLKGLSMDDQVAIVKYAESRTALLDFTRDKQAAVAAIGQLRFNLGFGSLNLSASISKVLDWLGNAKGKKTIVLLSTGVDTSPIDESALVLQQLKMSDVRLLVVSLMGGLQNPTPTGKKKTPAVISTQSTLEFERANQLLKHMAELTGGRAYFPVTEKEFDAAYAEIAQLVRHEYNLAFAPPVRDGRVHSIQVRVDTPRTVTPPAASYRIDHRQAYLAPAPR